MQHDPLSQSIRYIESSSLEQDAEVIHQLVRDRQQQTFTFVSNNMNTAVRFDHMGVYVESTLSEVPDAR